MNSQNDTVAGEEPDADFEIVSADPAKFYKTPAAIAAADDISTEQKLRLLHGWQQDITDRQTASSEGMTLSPGSPAPVRAITLEDVHTAITAVGVAEPVAPVGAMRTLWRRLVGTEADQA